MRVATLATDATRKIDTYRSNCYFDVKFSACIELSFSRFFSLALFAGCSEPPAFRNRRDKGISRNLARRCCALVTRASGTEWLFTVRTRCRDPRGEFLCRELIESR